MLLIWAGRRGAAGVRRGPWRLADGEPLCLGARRDLGEQVAARLPLRLGGIASDLGASRDPWGQVTARLGSYSLGLFLGSGRLRYSKLSAWDEFYYPIL